MVISCLLLAVQEELATGRKMVRKDVRKVEWGGKGCRTAVAARAEASADRAVKAERQLDAQSYFPVAVIKHQC